MELFSQLPTLARAAEETFTPDDLNTKLTSGRQLRIKWGVDVTAPFLHIGHAVNLWAMREMQDLGHKVVLLIGDFTTRIGDPTGKSKTRPQLSEEQITRDAEGFIEQCSQILRTSPDVFEVRRNSEWWEEMSLRRFLELLSMITHARLISRDMFQRRIADNTEIHMHEMLYPILQGYDSWALDADITIVGSEQLFNEMMGRFFQERLGAVPQVVITTRITPGIDGGEKQSKSLGNYIALSDSPRDKFGKIMSLPDHLVIQYLETYTLVPTAEIERLAAGIASGSNHPMDVKRLLGRSLVERYHGAEIATTEDEWFTAVFSKRKIPDDIVEVEVPFTATVLDAVRTCLAAESASSLRRLITQGAVEVHGGSKLTDTDAVDWVVPGVVLRVGRRRWFRLTGSN